MLRFKTNIMCGFILTFIMWILFPWKLIMSSVLLSSGGNISAKIYTTILFIAVFVIIIMSLCLCIKNYKENFLLITLNIFLGTIIGTISFWMAVIFMTQNESLDRLITSYSGIFTYAIIKNNISFSIKWFCELTALILFSQTLSLILLRRQVHKKIIKILLWVSICICCALLIYIVFRRMNMPVIGY